MPKKAPLPTTVRLYRVGIFSEKVDGEFVYQPHVYYVDAAASSSGYRLPRVGAFGFNSKLTTLEADLDVESAIARWRAEQQQQIAKLEDEIRRIRQQLDLPIPAEAKSTQ